jgi:hypothetical protein
MKAKRRLYDFNVTGIAVTDGSQGGACSLLNEPLLLKSLKGGATLTPEQKAILLEIGHTESEVGKSLTDDKLPLSSSEETSGGDNLTIEGTDMSEELIKGLQEQVAALKKSNIQKDLGAYGFEADVANGLADVLVGLEAEGLASVTKALDAVVAKGEAEVELAKAAVPAPKEEENPLAKALSEEKGEGGEPEGDAPKTMLEKALAAKDKIQGVV